MSNPWDFVPSDVYEDSNRAEQSEQWLIDQRRKLSQQWLEGWMRQAEDTMRPFQEALGGLGGILGGAGEAIGQAGESVMAAGRGLTPDWISSNSRGMVSPVELGNIDLGNRPVVRNQDGSISTVRSMSVNVDGQEVLIPTVSDDGRVMSDDEAVDTYLQTGRHLGKFRSPEDATTYAEYLHQQQAGQYGQMKFREGAAGILGGAGEAYQEFADLDPTEQRARVVQRLVGDPLGRVGEAVLDIPAVESERALGDIMQWSADRGMMTDVAPGTNLRESPDSPIYGAPREGETLLTGAGWEDVVKRHRGLQETNPELVNAGLASSPINFAGEVLGAVKGAAGVAGAAFGGVRRAKGAAKAGEAAADAARAAEGMPPEPPRPPAPPVEPPTGGVPPEPPEGPITIRPFGRVDPEAAAVPHFEEAAAVPRPPIPRAVTEAKADLMEVTPDLVERVASQPKGEQAVTLTALRKTAAGLWEKYGRVKAELESETIAGQVGTDQMADIVLKQGVIAQAEKAAKAVTEAARREASETGRALNSMLIAVNGHLADKVAIHYGQVQQIGKELTGEIARAAGKGKGLSKNGQGKLDDLRGYLEKEAAGEAVPEVVLPESGETAAEAAARGRRVGASRRAGAEDPVAAKAAEKAAPDPEMREFLDLLYKQRAASARHDENAVYAAQRRMDELMDGFLAKARQAKADKEAEKAAKLQKLVGEEGVDALGDAEKAVDPEQFDLKVMAAIQKRVESIVAKETAEPSGEQVNEVRQLVEKAFGQAYNTGAEQKIAAKASVAIEREMNKTLGKAWRQIVGEHVTRVVEKLRSGGYPLEGDIARAEAAMYAMAEQRPDLAKVVARFREEIRKAEVVNTRLQIRQIERAGRGQERAIKEIARDLLTKLDHFRSLAPDTPEYRRYANDVLRGLSRYGTAAEEAKARHYQLANRAKVRRLLTGEEKTLPAAEQSARIDELAAQLARFTEDDWADPRAFQSFANAMKKESLWEKSHRYRLGSMLSGMPTMLLNLGGSGLETALAIPVRTIAGVSERVRPVQRGAVNATERMALDEIEGWAEGFTTAFGEFRKTWETGVGGRIRADVKGQAVGDLRMPTNIPLRILQATDDFWYTLNFSSALKAEMRLASRQTGKSMDSIRLNLVNHPEVVDRAAEQAARRTYTQETGRITRAVNVLRDNPVGQTIQPFFNTIANMAAIGAERSILPGAGGFSQAGKFAKQGDFARAANRRAEGIMGASMMAAAGIFAWNGKITGYGPTDPKEREDWFDQGYQPYSVKVGNNWVSYANWGSLIIPLALSASAVEALREGGKETSDASARVTRGLTAAATSFGNLWVNVAALRGVADVVNAITQPDRFMGKFAEGVALSYMSPGFLRSLARVFDPEVKDPEGYLDALKSGMPGLSQAVKPRLTQLGQARMRQSGPGALMPFRSSDEKPSPIYSEYQRLRESGQDVGIGHVGNEIEGVKLTEDEQAQYQQIAGQLLAELLPELMNSREYSIVSDKDKSEVLQRKRDQVRVAARKIMMNRMGDSFIDRYVLANRR